MPEKKTRTFYLRFIRDRVLSRRTHTPGPFERTPNTKRVLPFRCALVAGGPVFTTGCFFFFLSYFASAGRFDFVFSIIRATFTISSADTVTAYERVLRRIFIAFSCSPVPRGDRTRTRRERIIAQNSSRTGCALRWLASLGKIGKINGLPPPVSG